MNALMSSPVFTLPISAGDIKRDKAAFDVRVGFVLQQKELDKMVKPIGYWSTSLTDAKRQYGTIQKGMSHYRVHHTSIKPTLEITSLTMRTDHDFVKWIKNLTDSSGRLASSCLRLSKYEFNVVNRAEIWHQAADALSRLHTTDEDPANSRTTSRCLRFS